ncbi:hypothetical protein [Leucobacter insecticola]|nr:hypothetical protein [Leucobacter insecticola]
MSAEVAGGHRLALVAARGDDGAIRINVAEHECPAAGGVGRSKV